jgi:NAD(P)H-flavin reductase
MRQMGTEPLVPKKSSLARARSALAGALARLKRDPTDWKTVDPPPAAKPTEYSRIFKIRLAPDDGIVPSFKPGQYVFLSFPGSGILSSPRPFTIASSPAVGKYIDILAKDSGEWSGAAKLISPGTRARVWGPYGQFSYLETPGSRRFVFIAGGIGAAPFLSMLRYMTEEDRDFRLLFIWGARTRDDLVEKEALLFAGERMSHFRFVPVLSHDPRWTGEKGRIDREKIERLVPAFFAADPRSFEWNSASYRICGPDGFNRDLKRILRDFGALPKAVHTESFDL